MRRLRQEVHHRLLGNGCCQRPGILDCHFEAICETFIHFATDVTFTSVLLHQREHVAANTQEERAALFDRLLVSAGYRVLSKLTLQLVSVTRKFGSPRFAFSPIGGECPVIPRKRHRHVAGVQDAEAARRRRGGIGTASHEVLTVPVLPQGSRSVGRVPR